MNTPTTPTASTISAPSSCCKRARVEVWADDATGRMLTTRFAYCFYAPPGSDYPPILNLNPMEAGTPITIHGAGGSITALPFEVHHGTIDALGFRIGGMAYTPDIDGVPDAKPASARRTSTCGSSMACAAPRIPATGACRRRWNGLRA